MSSQAREYYKTYRVRLLLGDVRESLKLIESETVNCVTTSPPYYNQRDYATGLWEGGDPNCNHSKSVRPMAERANPSGSGIGKGGAYSEAQDVVRYTGTCPDCGAISIDNQIGRESTLDEYIQNLVEVFLEVKRVLRKDGVLFLNLGDKMSGSGGAHKSSHANPGLSKSATRGGNSDRVEHSDLSAGSMMSIPWRVAWALQEGGWILRSAINWVKASSMPESVSSPRWEQHKVKIKGGGYSGRRDPDINPQPLSGISSDRPRKVNPDRRGDGPSVASQPWNEYDDCPGCKICSANGGLVLRWGNWRPTKSYELIFMFSKSQRYYADGDAVRQPHKAQYTARYFRNSFVDHEEQPYAADVEFIGNLAGANLRDTWEIASQGFRGQHYASYPPELVRRCVSIGTSEKGACNQCGDPWIRVISKGENLERDTNPKTTKIQPTPDDPREFEAGSTSSRPSLTVGWLPSCKCQDSKPVPATVLDPFLGSGTTAFVARTMGRNAIGCDLSEEYLNIAIKRIVVEGRTIN